MFSDKLLSLLQTFSRYDLNRFRKFLQSPYFNDQEDVTRLFELINDAIRKGADALAALDKPTVWKALFLKQALDDGHLRRLTSDLTLLAQRFLVEEARQKDPLSEALDLQKVLEKPELRKHLSGAERQIEKLLAQSEGKSTDFYYAQFRQHWNIFNRASKIVATTGYTEKLILADFFLECYYIGQKLKLYISWLLYRGFRVTEQEVPIIPGFWEYLKEERFTAVPLIHIYRKVILCFTDSEEELHFQQLLSDLKENADELTPSDLRECYYMAQNYCALKINQGKSEYYREVLGIFKSMVVQGILVADGQLPEAVFKNVITVSLRFGEYAWTENFIHEYIEYLPANIRENARIFNLANLYSHQKKHTQVIELLRNVEYSDVVYSLGSKVILVRTYYDLGEYLALDSLIDSFRIYLRRNKVLSKNLKREYNNFLNLVKKLTTIDTRNPKEIAMIRKRVAAVSYATPKRWLNEKIKDIEEK
jgi:hypothetical protein